uniref:NADH-ubiquinone oxidoreductase chain 5 n=2 Tax=Dastarcus helophoroides TaxID=1169899 RepID=A0A059SWZ9_9CUCU|nr:NADH dehydrogenase subunit 5 [Dastarcus helophoroides]AHG24985.1 NADH dehydrogenase subunit 5 [Dastarcus helophoroides]
MSICFIYFSIFLFFSLMFFMLSLMQIYLDYSMIIEINLLSLSSSSIIMTLILDWMSLLFMSFVLFISSMVVFYSEEYMEGDLNLSRFIMLVSMFVLSMMLMIISPNLISILLGWDGLGLVSYCLVIYYQNIKSYNAGMLTALTNRIGDVMLLLSIAWMLNYGSWNYIYYIEFMKIDYSMQLISLMIVLAAFTKSAQIPFSSWLPAAMAAPTPVSSLVHSSTLVTAGVYLLIRFHHCFSSEVIYIGLLISCLTMFMAGLGANYEFDLKKIIALSTLSQLGLMMSILFLGDYLLAFYHLLTHALFKALLFLCAGNIIHNLNNCQDIRYMGNLINLMPLTCTYFNISNLSLCGLPFLSGFYSKDLIVEFMSMNMLNIFIYFIFYLSIGLTVCYSFRLTYYSLLGNFNFLSINMVNEKSFLMLKGMGGLIILVVIGGSMLNWFMFMPYFICLSFFMKMLTLICIILGVLLGLEFSKFSLSYKNKSLNFYMMSTFFSSMWYMPQISTLGVNYYPLSWGKLYYFMIDLGWLEFLGSQNIYNKLMLSSNLTQMFYKNNLKLYLILLVLWIIIILFSMF